jgi:hypothetical protein
MPKVTDFFPSNYLRCPDLNGDTRIVTIDRVETAEFENDGRKQKKPVVYFKEAGIKPLVCNKTNMTAIALATKEEDSDNWGGKQICLFPDLVSFKGTTTEAIRIRRAFSMQQRQEEFNDSANL